MKHNKITVVSISDPTGTLAPSAGANGELGPLALDRQVIKTINSTPALSSNGNINFITDGTTNIVAISAGMVLVQSKGGWIEVASTTERNALSSQRRDEGMVVWVKDISAAYQLKGGISNGDWHTLNTGGSTSSSSADSLRITNLETAMANLGAVFTGQIDLDTTTNIYSVVHSTITGASYPVISVVVPASGSILYAESVFNVSPTGFDVALSSLPATSGYKLNWQIATVGATPVYFVNNNVPALSSSAGSFKDIAIDSNYIYVCIETNTWKRAALTGW